MQQRILFVVLLALGVCLVGNSSLAQGLTDDECLMDVSYDNGDIHMDTKASSAFNNTKAFNGTVNINNATNTMVSNQVELQDGDYTGSFSALNYDAVISYFEASDYYDFGAVRLTWSPNDVFTGEASHSPRIYIMRQDITSSTSTPIEVLDTCVDFNEMDYIDWTVGSGKTYVYYAQAYVLDGNDDIYSFSALMQDTGRTMTFDLFVDQNTLADASVTPPVVKSDGEINIQWEVDANCLVSDNDKEVYFEVWDETNDVEVWSDVIDEPEKYLVIGTFFNDNQLNFDGETSYITLNSGIASELGYNWTIEAWLRPDTSDNTTNDHFIFSSSEGYGLSYRYDTDSLAGLYYTDANGVHDLDATIEVDDWDHIAVTSSYSSTYFYINGAKVAQVNDGLYYPFDYIGNPTGSNTLFGAIAQVRFWSVKRNTEEVQFNYLYGMRGNEQNLVAYYRLEEGFISGVNVVYDDVSNLDSDYQGFWTEFLEPTEDNVSFAQIETRHVDQDATYEYRLNIFEVGTGDTVCAQIDYRVKTSPLDVDVEVTASDDDPGKIVVSWELLGSDWADGYNVYRRENGSNNEDDYIKIAFIDKENDRQEYHDYFDFEDKNSIQIGVEYQYKIVVINNERSNIALTNQPVGSSFPYSLALNPQGDSVFLSWTSFDGIADGYDSIKITRDGELMDIYTNLSQTDAVDPFPVYGQTHEYGVIFIKDGEEYAGVFNSNYTDVNGSLTGRIMTKSDELPLQNVLITISASIDEVEYKDEVYTDSLGFYEIEDIYYSKSATYTIVPTLTGHSFVGKEDPSSQQNSAQVTFNRFSSDQELDFFSLMEFQYVSSNQFDVNNLVQVATDTVQYFKLSWTNAIAVPTASSELDFYYNVYRDNELIDVIVESSDFNSLFGAYQTSSSVYIDSTANPGSSYDYKVVAYYFQSSDKVLIDSAVANLNFGVDVPNNVNSFVASPLSDYGTVELSWLNDSSWNIDGYIFTRNGQNIDTVYNHELVRYVDYAGIPGSISNQYGIYTFINNESDIIQTSTISKTDVSDFPSLPTVTVTPNDNTSAGLLQFDLSFDLSVDKEDYNFTGVMITKTGTKTDTIGLLPSEFFTTSDLSGIRTYSGQYVDREGIAGSYVYKIGLYRAIDDNTVSDLRTVSGVPTYPLSDAPIFTNAIVKANQVVQLNWTYDVDATADSISILRDNEEIDVVPVGQLLYVDVAENKNYSPDYQLLPFKYEDGRHDHNTSAKISPSVSKSNHAVVQVQDFEASYFYHVDRSAYKKYVVLSWDYPDYIYAEFEIYRDGKLLETLDREYRQYKDYTAEYGHDYSYQIRTKLNGNYSDYVSTIGNRISPYAIHGRILSKDGLSPVEDAEVKLVWEDAVEALHWVTASSDSSGHYQFYNVPVINEASSMTLSAFKNGYNFSSETLSFEADQLTIDQDLIDNSKYKTELNTEVRVSEIIAVSTFSNEETNEVEIRWIPEHKNYDGFYIYRDYEAIADVQVYDDNFIAYDLSGEPGNGYIYSVQAYWQGPSETEQSEIIDAPGLTIYPGYSQIKDFIAINKLDSNQVELYWSHFGAADYFELYRSEELLDTIYVDEQHEFIDTTGSPGINYSYAIRAYLQATEEYTDFTTVTLTYPSLMTVSDFDAETDDNNNQVELTWSYSGKAIDGFYVYRNEYKMATLGADIKSWVDTTGIPETWHEYEICAYREDIDGDQIISENVMDTAYFPELVTPQSFDVVSANNVAKLTWAYGFTNVEGFYIHRVSEGNTKVLKKMYVADSLDDGSYEYIDKEGSPKTVYTYKVYAFDGRGTALDEYLSDAAEEPNFNYPDYPSLSNTGYSQNTTYIEISWEYNWEYVEGFLLSIDGGSDIELDANTRTYLHHTHECEGLDISHTYKVTPFRELNGVPVSSNGNSNWNTKTSLSATNCGATMYVNSFEASQGTHRDKVKLKWDYDDTNIPDKVTIQKRLLEESTFTDLVTLTNSYSFYEDDEIYDGYEYVYKIVPVSSSTNQQALTTSGWSEYIGNIAGYVKSYEGNFGVAGVSITLSGEYDGVTLRYSGETDENGLFNFSGIFTPKEDTLWFTVSASLGDHEFLNNDQEVYVTSTYFSTGLNDIYDLESSTISGYVNSVLGCPMDSVTLTMYYVDAKLNSEKASEVQTEEGYFNFNPLDKPNLEFIAIKVSNIYNSVDADSAYWGFKTDSVVYVWDDVKGTATSIDFDDTVYYPMDVSVENGCGWSIGDYSFQIAVESANGCYYENYDTDYAGNLTVNLAPDSYTIRVVDVSPLDITSQAVLDYMRVRPQKVKFDSVHQNMIAQTSGFVNPYEELSFIFHKTPTIQMAGDFEDFGSSCTDWSDEFYLVAQDTDYEDIKFTVTESYDGESCPVSEGFLIVKNQAAVKSIDYIEFENTDVAGILELEDYDFTGSEPASVSPYLKGMTVEYWSGDLEAMDNAEFMKDATFNFVVTGSKSNDNEKDIIVSSEAYSEVNLPLFVLRDPPGDKSYSYIKSGSKITRTFGFEGIKAQNFNIKEQFYLPIGWLEFDQDYVNKSGTGDGYKSDFKVTLQVKEELKTAGSAAFSTNEEGYIMGESADVVVGMGIALQYGITENIDFDDSECKVIDYLSYAVSMDSITTTWIYTRSQIENLIRDYDNKLDDENFEVSRDGATDFSDTLEDIKNNWEEILDVLDIYSLPHYQFCLNNEWGENSSIDNYDRIETFCKTFFNGSGDQRSLKSGVVWNDGLINEYNELVESAVVDFDELLAEIQGISQIRDFYDEDLSCSDCDYGFEVDWDEVSFYHDYDDNLNDWIEKSEEDYEAARALFEAAYQAPKIENYTFGGNTTYKKEVKSKLTSKVSFKQHYKRFDAYDLALGGKTTIKSKTKIEGSGNSTHGNAAPTPMFFIELESGDEIETARSFGAKLKFGQDFSFKVTDKSGFTLDTTFVSGYVLSDDDDGDQFSTMVVNSAIPGHTPYFELIGGRSSCPYETGTVDRDRIDLSIVDDKGYPTNSAQYDLDPLEFASFNIAIANNSYFGEDRWIDISTMPLLNGEVENIYAYFAGEKIRPTKRLPVWVPADSSTVITVDYLRISDEASPYDFDNIQLFARPYCEKYPFYGDTINMEAYFIKPCSEVAIAEPESGWVINLDDDGDMEGEERVMLKIQDYNLDEELRHLDSIILQYRKEGSNSWTYYDGVTLKELQDYYQDYKKIYRNPTYPFIWNISDMNDITDGTYELRAFVECGTDGYSLSNVVSGTVNRSSLGVEGFPEPLDKVYSFGDAISVNFNDVMDKHEYDLNNISITASEGGTVADFKLEWGSRDILVFFENEDIKDFDGDTLTISISDVKDVAGNYLKEDGFEDGVYAWSFVVDYFRKAPSPVTIVSPNEDVFNLKSDTSLKVVFADFDIYQKEYSLDSLVIEYKHVDSLDWCMLAGFDHDSLLTRWEEDGDVDLDVSDTVELSLNGMADGEYLVRIHTFSNKGVEEISSSEHFYLDKTLPKVFETSPEDGIFHQGDEVSVTFDEELLFVRSVKSEVALIGNDTANFDYTVRISGDKVVFFFDENELEEWYMDTVEVTIYDLKDKYSNLLEEVTFTFAIGNLGKFTSGVSIALPIEDFRLTLNDPSLEIVLSDYEIDQHETALDSIKVQYKRIPSGNWTEFETITLEELRTYYLSNKALYEKPSIPVAWSPTYGVEVADGNYLIRAIAYNDGFMNYSDHLSGYIDFSRPIFEEMSITDSALTKGTQLTFTWSENIDALSVTDSNVVVKQVVIGGSSLRGFSASTDIVIDTTYYEVTVEGNEIHITFTDLFYTEFEGETVTVTISGIHDEYGNEIPQDMNFEFVVYNSEDAGGSLSMGTNLRGAYHSNGVVELNWNNPHDVQFDQYIVERSQSGLNFSSVDDVVSSNADEYQYFDRINFKDQIYYRLKQIDYDSNHIYTKVVVIADNGRVVPINTMVYPNPSDGRTLSVLVNTNNFDIDVELNIYDLSGNLVDKTILPASGLIDTIFKLKLNRQLLTGIYSVEVKQGESVEFHKLVVGTDK